MSKEIMTVFKTMDGYNVKTDKTDKWMRLFGSDTLPTCHTEVI